MTRRPAQTYPFSAIVGQDDLKTALLLNAIDPRVGGVLIRGEKGTAKSTAVRALASILPEIRVIESCAYACDPFDPAAWCDECRARSKEGELPKLSMRPRVVDLPVSATEDRLVGTLDFEAALKQGERAFHPGLLAAANRGILYVDEVNLLDDHLVDTLLDAAAMGVNTVEREGVSVVHPARFILVGTMNPEEGEIRPQLLDRFGLCVEISAIRDTEDRVEIMRRRRAFEDDPRVFAREWSDAEAELRARLDGARHRLASVRTGEEILYAIADLSVRAGVDGHRADTVMARAAAAYAAYDGRTDTTLGDVDRVAPYVLVHRLRRTPLDQVSYDPDTLRTSVVRALAKDGDESAVDYESTAATPGQGQVSIFDTQATSSAGEPAAVEVVSPQLEARFDRTRRSLAGKRHESVAADGRGRYTRAEKPSGSPSGDIAIDATIRAAVGNGAPSPEGGNAVTVTPDDLRTKVRTRKVGASIVFCVDASGSMGAASRIDAAKSAVLQLLSDAYQRRDRVALVSFRGDSAEVILAPTASIELASLKLKNLPTGGATPIAAGIDLGLETLRAEQRRQADTIGWLVLITDGRANVGLSGGVGSADALTSARRFKQSGFRALVLDTTTGLGGGDSAREIAEAAGAEYVRIGSTDGRAIESAVRQRI